MALAMLVAALGSRVALPAALSAERLPWRQAVVRRCEKIPSVGKILALRCRATSYAYCCCIFAA